MFKIWGLEPNRTEKSEIRRNREYIINNQRNDDKMISLGPPETKNI